MDKPAETDTRVVYVAHPASGLARSNFPLVCEVRAGRIERVLPFHLPETVRLYEIQTSRGTFRRSRKEVQMPLAYAWKQRIASEQRLRYPLLRRDWTPGQRRPEQRGRSGYVRISWDQALDIVAEELARLRERYGSLEPLLVQADGHGQSGYLQSLHFWGHYLFDQLRQRRGFGWWTQQIRNPDSWEGYYWGAKHVWGFEATLGEPLQDAVWDDVLEHAEMVIFSGNDPEATGFGMSGSIALEMTRWLKRAGIKIVAIAPDLNYAAAVFADTWIPIRPNTDAALYLALAYTWIVEERYDREYVASHTIGFETYRRHVLGEDDGIPKTPRWAEAITGIPARTIRALAREWAQRNTSLAVYFGGPKIRGTFSHLAARLEAYTMALQGIGRPGRQFLRVGAPSFYKEALAQIPRYPSVDRHGIALNPLIEYAIGRAPQSRVFVPRTLVAEAILDAPIRWRGTAAALAPTEDQFVAYCYPPGPDHPGIRAIWNENGSQVGSWGFGWKWVQALRHPAIEWVVGIHPWLENDLGYADLILPAQTLFEHEDLIAVQRSDLLAMFYQEAAIPPVGEALSDYEIHRRIGQRLGVGEAFPTVDEWLAQAYRQTLAWTRDGIGWEEFKQRRMVIYDCPSWPEWVAIKAEHGLPPHGGGMHRFWVTADGLQTPSGKIEFVSSRIAQLDGTNRERRPLAGWLTAGTPADTAAAYPLSVAANHPRLRFHVQGDDLPWLRELAKVPAADGYQYEPCWIHPQDAGPRGIADGDIVLVYNRRGGVLFGAVLTERVIAGSLRVEHGARIDLVRLGEQVVDRGGSINLIAPSPQEKYGAQEEIRVPEMNVSGFCVEARRIDPAAIVVDATLNAAGPR